MPLRVRIREVFYYFAFPVIAPLVRKSPFTLDDQTYNYGTQRKNLMLGTERAVEVPVALDYVQRYHDQRILEIGNVLGQYTENPNWDIVDKYEPGNRVINQDILDFQPSQPYDLIISVSTLEHVGFNEPKKDPGKFEQSLIHIQEKLLAPGGKLLVTLPLGWNPRVDELFNTRKLPFDKITTYRRTGWTSNWIPTQTFQSQYTYGTCIGADWLLICTSKKH